jgi:hypothetical protein
MPVINERLRECLLAIAAKPFGTGNFDCDQLTSAETKTLVFF